MNKSTKYLGLLAILPLITIGLASQQMTTVFAATEADTECRAGNVLVLRAAHNNYACISEESAQKWEQLGIATIVGKSMEKPHMEDSMEKSSMEDSMEKPAMSEPKMDSMEETHEEHAAPGSLLKLSRANVPATIPLHHGFYDGGDVHFIITDSSDQTHADLITESQDWRVEMAPLLANAPDTALSTTYMFTNGVNGDGVHGFQSEVFTSTPAQPDVYSGLSSIVHVTWNDSSSASVLSSATDIQAAADAGNVVLEETGVVLNTPHIVWPDGQMQVKEDKTLADDTPYGGGQVLDINTDEMTVTFVAHRGWGPDGRTIYYIVTDATPSGPAGMMGVVDAPTSAALIANSAAVDLFQFRNGITGSGPLGFQPGIAAGAPGDANYSPMWRIFMIGWENPDDAALLETKADIDAYQAEGLISVGLARPMDSDHIVNCPFIDPFQ